VTQWKLSVVVTHETSTFSKYRQVAALHGSFVQDWYNWGWQ